MADGVRMGEAEPDSAQPRRLYDVTDMQEADVAEMDSSEEAPEVIDRSVSRPKRDAKRSGGGKELIRRNARILGALALLAIGIVFVLLGWYGAANTNILTEQIPYLISGGLLGLGLIVVAGFLASSAGVERANEELRRDLVRALGSMSSGQPANGPMAPTPHTNEGHVYIVPGGHSYHAPGCPIVEGKSSSPLPLTKAIESGFSACKLCGPD